MTTEPPPTRIEPDVELTSLRGNNFETAPDTDDATAFAGVETVPLPPMDGGRQAWLFLAACFILEGLIWGDPLLSNTNTHHGSTPANT